MSRVPIFTAAPPGLARNFEVDRESGRWKRFETDLAKTPQGELILRLRGGTTWDVVYDRIAKGVAIEEKIETIEDLAAYLEKCFA